MTSFAEASNRPVAAAGDAAAEAAREGAKADEAAAPAAWEAAKVGDALAREHELVLDVVALRFGLEVARRVRPVPEAMDGPDGIHDVRSRAMAGASEEDLLRGLGLSDGRSP